MAELAVAVTATGFRAQYEVSSDGQKFLLNVPVDKDASSSPAITVVLNWSAGLRN